MNKFEVSQLAIEPKILTNENRAPYDQTTDIEISVNLDEANSMRWVVTRASNNQLRLTNEAGDFDLIISGVPSTLMEQAAFLSSVDVGGFSALIATLGAKDTEILFTKADIHSARFRVKKRGGGNIGKVGLEEGEK